MRTISALEAIYKRIVSSALKGDLKAIKLLLEMYAEIQSTQKHPKKFQRIYPLKASLKLTSK
jgi:hypothetical protein